MFTTKFNGTVFRKLSDRYLSTVKLQTVSPSQLVVPHLTISKYCLEVHISTLHSVRGQSGFCNLALTERNIQIKFYLKLSVYSLGVEIWLLSFKFNFGLMGWPPQPPRDRVLKINKIVGFWWSISHWETRIGIFGAMIDGNIKLRNLFYEMRLLRSLRPLIF